MSSDNDTRHLTSTSESQKRMAEKMSLGTTATGLIQLNNFTNNNN